MQQRSICWSENWCDCLTELLQKQAKDALTEDKTASDSDASDIDDVPVFSNLNMLEKWLAQGHTQIKQLFASRDEGGCIRSRGPYKTKGNIQSTRTQRRHKQEAREWTAK